MIKALRFFFMTTLLVALGTVTAQAQAFKIGLVLEENSRGREAREILSATTQAFTASRRFIVAERESLDKIIAEQELSTVISDYDGDLTTLSGLEVIGMVRYTTGREKSAQGGYYTTYWIDVQLMDVKTGEVLRTVSSRRATILDPTTPAAAGKRLLQNLREAFPAQGYIIRISGGLAMVDIGAEAGVRKGDNLVVIRKGKSIIHPVTGEVILGEEIEMGVLKVIDSSGQLSTCKVKKTSGLTIGDQVRLKPKSTIGQSIFRRIIKIQ